MNKTLPGSASFSTESSAFARDRFTWLAYVMLAYYAYLQAILGPLMPFLRDKLDLSYTLGGLHFTAFATGTLVTGMLGDRVVRRGGRRAAFWGGGAGMGLGGLLVGLGNHVAVTLLGALLLGLLGTFLLMTIQSALADHHGRWRATALLEANVGASVCATLAPLLVGGFQQAGAGWSTALLAAAFAWLAVALAWRLHPVPAAAKATAGPAVPTRRLPPVFWAYWLAIVLGVAAEWSVAFWGAEFLLSGVGLAKAEASTAMSLFFMAMVLGRIAGSRLTRTIPSSTLLLGVVALALVGFPIFWRAPLPVLNIAGLFVTGLGIANYYPLTMSIATGLDPQQSDTASARVTMGVGLAMLVAPQVLGWLADQVEIQNAYGIVILLLAVAAAVIAVANHLAGKQHSAPNSPRNPAT